ncbi:hypothetical protein BC831DRAFT_453218 [Entophlyctis helioformis]|nr:hypothetical protein BC831DRAFT_453218 [Entophlyctis helioformis]
MSNYGRRYNSPDADPAPPAATNKWAAAASAAERSHQDPTAVATVTATTQTATGYQYRDDAPEDWDNSDWLDGRTKQVQHDSRDSTRRALQRLNAAQETAEYNVNKLNQQSEQLHNIERRLDRTEHQAKVSDAKADYLKAVNRFFMIPAFGAGKAKRKEEELKKQEEADKFSGRSARERESEWDARNRRQDDYRSRYDAHAGGSNDSLNSRYDQSRSDDRSRSRSAGPNHHAGGRSGNSYDRMYTTPHGIDRDDVEEEIDSNLNEISSGLSRLKMMGTAMNEELGFQRGQMSRIADRTDSTRDRVEILNRKVENVSGKRR